jgi:hypothetical protein
MKMSKFEKWLHRLVIIGLAAMEAVRQIIQNW